MTHVLSQSLASHTMYPYHELVRRLNFVPLGPTLDGASLERIAACTRLERLVLAGCTGLTDARVGTVLSACPKLVFVDLSEVYKAGSEVSKALSKACRLQMLLLSGCERITGDMLSVIAKGCPRLKRVKLDRCESVTDEGVIALAQNCPRLVELDLSEVKSLTDRAIRTLWTHTENLRELRVSHCYNLTSSAFPDAATLDLPQLASDDTISASSAAPNGPPLLDAVSEEGLEGSQSLHLGRSRSAKRLVMGEQLRVIDLTGCEQISDAAITGLVAVAPRLRNVTLSKCTRLTDVTIDALGRLGKALHLAHLGRLDQITDDALIQMAHKCSRLRYLDVAYCSRLTNRAVSEIAACLPKLKRIGLVKMPNLTSEGVYALVARFHTLERIHLSYCDNLTIPPIFDLLVSLPHLTHLSLTGIPAFRRTDLQQFCRPPPRELTSTQRAIFCVYSGRGIAALRDYMKNNLFPRGTSSLLRTIPPQEKDTFLNQAMRTQANNRAQERNASPNGDLPSVEPRGLLRNLNVDPHVYLTRNPAHVANQIPNRTMYDRDPNANLGDVLVPAGFATGAPFAPDPAELHDPRPQDDQRGQLNAQQPPPNPEGEEDEDDVHVRAVEEAQRRQAIYNPSERPWSAARSGETMGAPSAREIFLQGAGPRPRDLEGTQQNGSEPEVPETQANQGEEGDSNGAQDDQGGQNGIGTPMEVDEAELWQRSRPPWSAFAFPEPGIAMSTPGASLTQALPTADVTAFPPAGRGLDAGTTAMDTAARGRNTHPPAPHSPGTGPFAGTKRSAASGTRDVQQGGIQAFASSSEPWRKSPRRGQEANTSGPSNSNTAGSSLAAGVLPERERAPSPDGDEMEVDDTDE